MATKKIKQEFPIEQEHIDQEKFNIIVNEISPAELLESPTFDAINNTSSWGIFLRTKDDNKNKMILISNTVISNLDILCPEVREDWNLKAAEVRKLLFGWFDEYNKNNSSTRENTREDKKGEKDEN